ncbi:MAG: sulfite exporter TauE/SafE family protein [Myxococcales bacterium]|nr:sulfite exporter TauE/SafE family protein [Myxococcales bacterium]
MTADPLMLALIAAVSLVLSHIGATVGLVLGQLRLPLLIYALASPVVGTATSLAISTAGTLVGTVRHAAGGRVRLGLLLTVGAPSAAAAYVSARHAGQVDQWLLKLVIAAVLVATGARMLVPRPPEPPAPAEPPRLPAPVAEIAVGVGLGALSGLVGLLLGSLRLPAMMRYARIPAPLAIGTNMAIGTLTGLSAGVATFREGNVDVPAFVVVGLATVVGAHLGAGRTGKLAPETLLKIIAWVLLGVGLLMLGEGLFERFVASPAP